MGLYLAVPRKLNLKVSVDKGKKRQLCLRTPRALDIRVVCATAGRQ